MSDPNLLTPQDYEFYRPQARPADGWPRRDTPDALLKALNVATDNLKKQEKINRVHLATNNRLESEIRSLKIKNWIMAGALVVLWEIFKALVLHR
jgi:hypothetical protein